MVKKNQENNGREKIGVVTPTPGPSFVTKAPAGNSVGGFELPPITPSVACLASLQGNNGMLYAVACLQKVCKLWKDK